MNPLPGILVLTSTVFLCPQRNSNPRFGLERATSWATRQWGLGRQDSITTTHLCVGICLFNISITSHMASYAR
jgi:hypothetical protein